MYSFNHYNNIFPTMIAIISVAFCATIIIYFVFMDKKEYYTGFLKKMYDYLHFNTFIIENLLKFFYIFFSILIIIFSIVYIQYDILEGLGILILGLVGLRIVFEGIMIIYKIYRNIKEINEKMK